MGEDIKAEIDRKFAVLADWRGEMLARLWAVIRRADPEGAEDIKWRKPSNPSGVAAWSHGGMICTGESYKNAVKLTFAHGAALDDPAQLFNASMTGGTRRAIDIHDGDTVDESALAALIKEAVRHNQSK